MSNFKRILLGALLSIGFVATPASATPIDQILQEVDFTVSGQGVSNAIVMIDGYVRRDDLSAADKARLVVRRIDFMTRDAKEIRNDDDMTLVPFAAKLAETYVFDPPGVSPEAKLKALELLHGRRRYQSMAHGLDAVFIRLAKKAVRDPMVEKAPGTKAALLMLEGDLHAKRFCKDLAVECYRAAADCYEDPAEKAAALFKGALASRTYRDMETSSDLLDEVAKLEGAPYDVQKRALLIRGENAIYPNEHSWSPTPERVAEARKYVEKALADRSPLVGKPETFRVLFTLVKAEAKIGDTKAAIELGEKLLDGKGAMKLDPVLRANLCVFLADTHHRSGDYKRAIKFYEQGSAGADIGRKSVLMRIANSARADQNFLRAMQAYSEAVQCCDPEEGKDEIAHITRLIRQMNKSVRKGASTFDSDAIFTDTNEDISGLSLDDE